MIYERVVVLRDPVANVICSRPKAYLAIGMLCEGMGIRSIERLTGLNRRTVLALLELAGQKCQRLLDNRIRNVSVEQVQIDELYAFVAHKRKQSDNKSAETGEFYTFLAIDKYSKMILSSRVGKRTSEEAYEFLGDLKGRVKDRFQITSDAWGVYKSAVWSVLGNRVDFAIESKFFSVPPMHIPMLNYFPRRFLKVVRTPKYGKPNMRHATTCHVERTNLTVRLFTRRFTRCTMGFSKKLQNLKFAVALFVAHFNFCRVHNALDQTPAMAMGLTSKPWSVEELINFSDVALSTY